MSSSMFCCFLVWYHVFSPSNHSKTLLLFSLLTLPPPSPTFFYPELQNNFCNSVQNFCLALQCTSSVTLQQNRIILIEISIITVQCVQYTCFNICANFLRFCFVKSCLQSIFYISRLYILTYRLHTSLDVFLCRQYELNFSVHVTCDIVDTF